MKDFDNNSLPFKIIDNGDAGLTVIFDQAPSEFLTRKILSIQLLIQSSLRDVIHDIIPAYQSITILFNLLEITKSNLKEKLSGILNKPIEPSNYQSKLLEIPVCYEPEYALDLPAFARHCEMIEQQVIELHTSQTYLVHMLGFLPGFLYLGGLSSQLFCPRKNSPATRIPAGSVAIGGEQTGIYPVDSPGGWHIIGRTPLAMFDPTKDKPAIASPLDKIKFISIGQSEFLDLQKRHKETSQ